MNSQDLNFLCRRFGTNRLSAAVDINDDGEINLLNADEFLANAGVILGDANLDGDVNFADFTVLSNGIGKPGVVSTTRDFNCDQDVDFQDRPILSVKNVDTRFGNRFC